MDDLNKSYQQIGQEEMAKGAAASQATQAADPIAIFKQFEQQAAQETGNPAGSDGALTRATQLVLENVIAPMPDEELANMTASDAAGFLFGFPDAAGEFGPEFDGLDPASKRQIISEIAGNSDTIMDQEQGIQADQMQRR